LKDLLTIVLYDSYPAIEQETFNYLSKKAADPLLSIIDNIKLFFNFSKDGDDPKNGSSGNNQDNFLDYLVIFS